MYGKGCLTVRFRGELCRGYVDGLEFIALFGPVLIVRESLCGWVPWQSVRIAFLVFRHVRAFRLRNDLLFVVREI